MRKSTQGTSVIPVQVHTKVKGVPVLVEKVHFSPQSCQDKDKAFLTTRFEGRGEEFYKCIKEKFSSAASLYLDWVNGPIIVIGNFNLNVRRCAKAWFVNFMRETFELEVVNGVQKLRTQHCTNMNRRCLTSSN